MSSSKLLEQAIVDAQALRDSAYKSAQATLLEKFAPQVKEAVEKLLEQGPEEDPAAGADPTADPAAAAPPTDFGGAPPDESNKGYVAGTAKDIPLAATDGEKLCPCPDEDGEVTLNIDLADLADQLKIGKEAEEEEDINMQPMLGGMQNPPPAAGGAAPMMESLELEEGEGEFELEEDLDENLTEVDLDEALSEMGPHGSDYEGTDDPKELQRKVNKDEEKLDKEKADLNKDGKLSGYEKARGKAIAKAMQKTNESKEVEQTKQLIKASSALLKEVENKDAKINKLLEENKKFSSTIEEMSEAFKKLEQVNTLNARLFYENQVLKSASLNERQKTHIVEAISKADSVSEAKAMYETLINSVGGSAEKERSPKSLNEAINKKSSFRLPHKQAEQPNDPGKDRWLKLAGIK
jgi:hypothetical protein